ncbi:membrane protein [Streptomyces phage TunaTartare]|uniref:Membrane protein n=1 Tax=Streptomyces phage TunaTartare TaxID=2848887 RepID=A0A8F2E6L2_9CAUD|nr:membrane protein [Streptomyces phage TunaTartare]QWT29917.1 membrane protein [Streptomyces phage TunaTartare]
MVNILKRAWKELATALSKPINKVAAVVLSVYTFLWGFWIANPFWDVFKHAELYSWLSDVAPETFWGILAMAVGAIMTYGVVRGSENSLTIGAFVGFIHWLIIAMGYFAGDWKNTGGITSSAMALYCAAIYLNIRYLHFMQTHPE